MGPIEGLWGALIVVFALVGVVRGFLRELGVTTILIALLFALNRLIPLLESFIRDGKLQSIGIAAFTGDPEADQSTNMLLMLVFSLITIAAVFIAYQGETLVYEGNIPKFPTGTLLGLLVGVVNGYLITGTLWWMMDHYHYPIEKFGLIHPETMTALARQILEAKLLPLDLLGAGVESVDSLGLLPIILVVLIVLKVVR